MTAANYRLKRYENDVLDRVNNAYIATASLALNSRSQAEMLLCCATCSSTGISNEKLELKSSLFGICDFKDGLASVEASDSVEMKLAVDRPVVRLHLHSQAYDELDTIRAQVLQERTTTGAEDAASDSDRRFWGPCKHHALHHVLRDHRSPVKLGRFGVSRPGALVDARREPSRTP